MIAIRAFEASDDERVVALYGRLRATDAAIPDLDLARFRAFRALSIFGEGRDFRVAMRDDAIIGLMTVGRIDDTRVPGGRRRIRVFVDPSARREGVATALLEAGERQARAAGVHAIESFVEGKWTGGRAFAAAHGFDVFVHDVFLARPPTPFAAVAPRGARLRRYAGASDDAAWCAISNATLARDTGFHPETLESVAAYARAQGFELWVAEEADTPIRFCHVERRAEAGYVQALGVVAAAEGRGVGAALLSRAIETLSQAGVARIELCTERDNARAQRLYARAGFAFDRDAFTLRKSL